MNVIDTSGALLSAFEAGRFDPEKWERYIDRAVPGAKELCLEDMRACIRAGYSWEKDFLPVLNAVARDGEKRDRAIRSFHRVADGLEAKLLARFHRSVETDLILYLGLCSGAGWVTPVRGRTTVLLGVEKIMELGWVGEDDMTGLICHELGHVYQDQYGVLRRELDALPDQLLWQLFTEGIATVFEQELAGDPGYFHQDKNGWKDWCERNKALIRQSFADDLPSMTHENQRYFGDWVRFMGYGDTGYYLGALFVRFLLRFDDFDSLVRCGVEDVKAGFGRFLRAEL
ncbi:MAG: hypothetical protein K6G17_03060 [Oscillospiraceae bacterium]|nr:hypothetical protein [Oscillospiraceae bacterium]